MKSKMLTITLVFLSFSLFGQQWMKELEKHKDKPVIEIIKSMDSYFDIVGATRENKYHHYIRWQHNAINHVNEEGKSFNYASKNSAELRKMEKLISKNKNAEKRYFHGAWESVNPNNFQTPTNSHPSMGRLSCVVKPSSNPNIIYVGSSAGGIWKTYNHGATWIPLWDGMSQMGVSDIIIDVNYENHLIAITGSANAKHLPTSGIIESWDSGNTWNMIYDVDMDQVQYGYKIVQNVYDNSEYYFGIDNTTYFDFKKLTTTGTPSVTSEGSVLGSVFDMEYAFGTDTTLFITSTYGLYKKEGTGSVIKVPSSSNLPSSLCIRNAVAVAPSDPNYIYYLHAINNDNYSIHRSTNGGETFQQMFIDTIEGGVGLVGQININLNLAVDPLNRDKIYLGSVPFSTSTNGGTSWTLDMEHMHADLHDIYFSHGNQYVCTDGGLSYRPLGTTDWIDINNGLLITQFYKMDVSGSKLVGGTQDNGTMFWNEGDAIGIRKVGSDGFDCLYDTNNDNTVFTTTQEELFRSTDNGETNNYAIPHRWAAPISFWPNNTDIVITYDKDDLRVSYDNGVTWPDSRDILPNSYLYSGFSQCTSNTNVAYACGDNEVVKTTNFANPATSNWQDITDGLQNSIDTAIFRNILVHPDSSDVVFVVKAGYNDTQLYKSVDGGDEWTPYNQGLPDIPVYCIYYDHVNGNGYYIGTELGVFYRDNSMQEWIPYSNYLPRAQVTDIKITDTHIYAATFGRGIWKSELYKPCLYSAGLYQSNDPTNGGPSGYQIHKFSESMTANRIIQGGEGTDVLYQAGNYIDLIPGFHARQYNLFTARAAGCLE